jgi:hypothetical protein
VGTGERRVRRRPAAGGAELGQLFEEEEEEEEEEKAAALGAGEARRWRSNGSHGSIDKWRLGRFQRFNSEVPNRI